MLSGVLIKALGVYTLIRIFFDCLSMSHTFAYVLMTLGVVSMVIGVFLAVGQWDFKRLLAYHSISQMGYVVLAVGVAGEMLITKRYEIASLALLGGLFHLFNHAVFKSLLFLCSGAVEYRTGTRLLKKLGGLKHKMPVTGACLRVAALSISGVPPFNGFWSKLIIIIAVIQSGHYGLGAVTVLVSFMTLLSFIKVQRYIVDGDPSEAVAPVQEAPLSMCVAMILLAVICVGAGILFPFMKDTLFESSQTMTSQSIIIVKNIISGG
jgi:multicomponent Na+:H+ antiporter subunit D